MSIQLRICGIAELQRYTGITHVISIWDSCRREDTAMKKEMTRIFGGAEIIYGFFDDIEEPIPGYVHPDSNAVRRLIEFAASCKDESSLLVHCHAGVSRSTAIGYAIACMSAGPGKESLSLSMVRNIRPTLNPNLLVVRHADALLAREGSMVREALHYRARILQRLVPSSPEDLIRLATRRAAVSLPVG